MGHSFDQGTAKLMVQLEIQEEKEYTLVYCPSHFNPNNTGAKKQIRLSEQRNGLGLCFGADKIEAGILVC